MSGPDLKKLAEEIGGKVQAQRKKKGQTLEDFSGGADISMEVLHRIERGKTLPQIRVLAKIGHYLKIKIRRLLP